MVKKILVGSILNITLLTIGLFTTPGECIASNKIAGHSATIQIEDTFQSNNYLNTKKAVIKKVLQKYNSNMVEYSDSFVDACSKYKIDCYLLASIAGVESYFGKYMYPSSNNPFGWGGGLIMFKDFDESINEVSKKMKENYVDKGFDTVEKIAPIYCPPSNTWSGKVNHFLNEFRQNEIELTKINSIIL